MSLTERWRRWRRQVARWATPVDDFAWQVDASGLRHGSRQWPWAVIQRVEEAPRWFEIHTADEVLRIEPKSAPARRLARRVRDGLAVRDGHAAGLTATEIEALLGVEPGGTLVVAPPVRSRSLAAVGLGCLLLWLVGLPLLDDTVLEPLANLLFLPLFLVVTLLPGLMQTPLQGERVSFDARGLRWATGAADWADVVAISADGLGYRVSTDADDGAVLLAGRHAERAAEAVRAVLDARRAGALLPRMGDVPETALSRAEAEGDAAERGLSRLS